MVAFLLIWPHASSCFNRFPGCRNSLYGCADNCGRNVMTSLRAVSLVLAGIVPSLLGTSVGASAQNYPNQVVRIVVPFSAGSITDGLARILADKLGELWKQQVIVENRPGLPGTTGVAKRDRKSTRLNSSHSQISYAVFCLKKKRSELAAMSHRII